MPAWNDHGECDIQRLRGAAGWRRFADLFSIIVELWDGEKTWRVGAKTDEQPKLPILRIRNDMPLVERLESDWTAETYAL